MTRDQLNEHWAQILLQACKERDATIAQRDAEIARLKARVAKLERPDAFWPLSYGEDDPAKGSLGEVYDAGEEDPLIPLEVICSATRPSIWLVLEHTPVDDDEVNWENLWHRFPTKEEAEAFCQKMRAEKGEGEGWLIS